MWIFFLLLVRGRTRTDKTDSGVTYFYTEEWKLLNLKGLVNSVPEPQSCFVYILHFSSNFHLIYQDNLNRVFFSCSIFTILNIGHPHLGLVTLILVFRFHFCILSPLSVPFDPDTQNSRVLNVVLMENVCLTRMTLRNPDAPLFCQPSGLVGEDVCSTIQRNATRLTTLNNWIECHNRLVMYFTYINEVNVLFVGQLHLIQFSCSCFLMLFKRRIIPLKRFLIS